jgi:hypothetical protein
MGLAQLPCTCIKSYRCRISEWLKTSQILQAGVFSFAYDNLCVGVVCGALYLFALASTEHKDGNEQRNGNENERLHNLD